MIKIEHMNLLSLSTFNQDGTVRKVLSGNVTVTNGKKSLSYTIDQNTPIPDRILDALSQWVLDQVYEMAATDCLPKSDDEDYFGYECKGNK